MQHTDPSKREYWDERVAEKRHDLDGMIFEDQDRDAFWDRVFEQLSSWKHGLRVLDVCCGWGRFSRVFDLPYYTGIDFSASMIELARANNPLKYFSVQDANEFRVLGKQYDVIFEVNSLRSLGMTPVQFREKFKEFSTGIVACIEKDQTNIFYFYDR